MKPLAELSADAGRRLIGVFTDIDDTLTTDGLLIDGVASSPANSWGTLRFRYGS